MRSLNLLLVVLLIAPAYANAQDANGLQPVTPTDVTTDESLQNPAVLLKPMQQKSGMNLSLIDDVCKQNERQTHAYRLQNAAVEDVAEAINQWLQQKLKSKQVKVNGFICNAPIIIVPQTQSNTLVVSTTESFAYTDELEQMIGQLDCPPKMIQIHAVIKKTVNGKTDVVSRPNIVVLENTTGSITVGSPDDQLTLEVTARVVSPENQVGPLRSRSAGKTPANKK